MYHERGWFNFDHATQTNLINFSRRQVLVVYTELAARFAKRWSGGGGGGDRHGDGHASRKRPRILHPGCGSSTLGVVLQQEHGCDVVNADFSEVFCEMLCIAR